MRCSSCTRLPTATEISRYETNVKGRNVSTSVFVVVNCGNSNYLYHVLLLFHHVIVSHPPQMSDFIEGNFLHEQVDAIKELSDHITNLTTRLADGHGEWHFDKELSD